MTVRYEAVNAMLLNELLKEHQRAMEEHRKVEEQGASIAQLKKQIKALTATVQEVSNQLERHDAKSERPDRSRQSYTTASRQPLNSRWPRVSRHGAEISKLLMALCLGAL
jgi:hypothetical protein